MQTPSRLLLRGCSERTKLYPDISKLSSSGELLELRYVSESQCRIYDMQDTLLTILTGKNCVLFNSVQEWLVGCFLPF